MLEVLTGKVLNGLSEFAGEKLFVGAHTEQDFFAEAKHVSGHCRVGWFQFHLQNAANPVIVPLPNVKFLTLRAGEAL